MPKYFCLLKKIDMAKGKITEGEFWTIIVNERNVTITIETEKLIDFCSKELGFYNYVEHTGNYILVRVKRKCIIEESRIEEVKQAIKHYLRKEKKLENVWAEFVKVN